MLGHFEFALLRLDLARLLFISFKFPFEILPLVFVEILLLESLLDFRDPGGYL